MPQFPDIYTPSGAVFIGGDYATAKYRPMLWRYWGAGPQWRNFLHVCGLNPSTAGAEVNDPTIRREIAFAKRWGFDGLLKTNLFDWRDTDPKKMMAAMAPVSSENNWWILECRDRATVSMAAWGVHGVHNNRSYELKSLIDWKCLGTTKDGHPKHPLYVKATTPLVPLVP